MKRSLTAIVPVTLLHVACCGGLLLLLASSGWLTVLASEAQSRTALLPLLAATGASLWLWHRQINHCRRLDNPDLGHRIAQELVLMVAILLIAVMLIVYMVIPLWIGDYQGEGVLPG